MPKVWLKLSKLSTLNLPQKAHVKWDFLVPNCLKNILAKISGQMFKNNIMSREINWFKNMNKMFFGHKTESYNQMRWTKSIKKCPQNLEMF